MVAPFESVVRAFFLNSEDIIEAHLSLLPLPPLFLKSGLRIGHSAGDPVEVLFNEIFLAEAYTNGFYVPTPRDNVIDCGANIGIFSLFLAQSAPGIRIFCFEPSARTRQRLINNIKLNHLESKITVFPFAITDREGPGRLRLAASSGDSSFFSRPENTSGTEESVDCLSLANALEMCDVERIDMLKIDVEGAEVEILGGARNVEWKRIQRVAVEYHDVFRPGCRNAIVGMLREYGFNAIGDSSQTEKPVLGILRASRLEQNGDSSFFSTASR